MSSDPQPEIEFARPFVLQRDTDITGVSGTGTVADGVVWPDGTVALRWRGRRPSSVTWDSIDDALSVHGHDGATRIVWSAALLVEGEPPDDGPTTGDDEPGGTPPTPTLDELRATLDALRSGQPVWQGPVEGYGTGHMLGLLGTLNGTQCTEADPCPLHAERPAPDGEADPFSHAERLRTGRAGGLELPPAKQCTKHTGADRQRYGCNGPEPTDA